MTYQVRQPQLPLAVYREIVAHLNQVTGVSSQLILQQAQQFDYGLSQIDRLQIEYSPAATAASLEQVQRILAYYSDRYGAWEEVTS